MGNLVQRAQHILLNTLTAKDFGVYQKTDGSGGTENVFFYKGSDYHAPIAIPKSNIKHKFVSRAKQGVKASYLMELVAPSPCEDCNYETGFTIGLKKHWDGSMWNSYPEFRYVMGYLPSLLPAVNGELDDADKKALLKQMIEFMNADKKGPAWGTMAYIVTDLSPSTPSDVNITIGETTTTVSSTAGDLAGVINDNTAVNDNVFAYNLGSDRIMIVGKDSKGYFNVEDDGSTTTTVDNFYLKVSERTAGVPINIDFKQNGQDWNTISKVFEWEIDTSDPLNHDFVGDGTPTTLTSANTIAAIGDFANIEGVGAEETATTDVVAVLAYNYNNAKLVMNVTGVAVPVLRYGVPQFAWLTGEEMYRIFPNHGVDTGMYPHLPDPNRDYFQIAFKYNVKSWDSDLPSAPQDMEVNVNFYIPESEISNQVWDTSDYMEDEASAGDAYLFDLLGYVSDSATPGTIGDRPDGQGEGAAPLLDYMETLAPSEWIH